MAFQDASRQGYFGDCPDCGMNDGYLNIARIDWFHCRAHKTKWRISMDRFSDGKVQKPELDAQNRTFLKDYRSVISRRDRATTQGFETNEGDEPLIDLETQAVAAERAITRYVKRYADGTEAQDG